LEILKIFANLAFPSTQALVAWQSAFYIYNTMGNTGSGSKAKRKAQAKRAQESGDVGPVITPGPNQVSTTLTIQLIKLDRSVVAQAAASREVLVSVVWHRTEYEVYWAGQYLGAVPANFNEQLHAPDRHAGRITEITGAPREAVTIQVIVRS
jgi:hypothetical protein